jgi:hypothetical protein
LQGELENTPFVTRVQRDSALKVPLFLRLHLKAANHVSACPPGGQPYGKPKGERC